MTIFLGDIHGELYTIRKNLKNFPENTSIIQVGDFGMGFIPMRDLVDLNHALESAKIDLYVVRGNHDSPSFFDGQKMMRTTLVKDYTVLNLEGKNILCAGGAISIDRKYRSQGRDYWKSENFVLQNVDREDIDIVVSHSAPDFCYPCLPWIDDFDPQLTEDCRKERSDLNILYQNLIKKNNIKKWIYGHFHESYSEKIEETEFKLLNIDEFYEFKHRE